MPLNDTTPTTKTCSKCGETKPVAEFSRNKNRRDGLQDQCKACNRAYAVANKERIAAQRREFRQANPGHNAERCRAYREANLERLREYDRARTTTRKDYKIEYDRIRYAANKEEDNARCRAWREANKELVVRRHREYYLANQDKVKRQVRNWLAANPWKKREYSLRRLARERNAEGSFTAADIQDQYARQKGKCYYCGCKVGDTYDVDHIVPLSRGGSNWPENLVIACQPCNRSKQDKLPHEWSWGGRLL